MLSGMTVKKSRRPQSHLKGESSVPARLTGLVRVAGRPIQIEIERHTDETRIDHVWLDVEAGSEGFFRIALNTWSRSSFASGYDPRIWVATVASTWNELPPSGIFRSDGLDYSTIETKNGGGFQPYERTRLEELLRAKFERAILIQAWGELYERGHRGLHQVHSRRASAVVQTDHVGRDGAIRFYYDNAASEILLFRFFGQS
jgi:hypothetical protein